MINPVQLDGEPAVSQIDRPEIKLSSTPQIVIAIPCGDKHNNTVLQCPTDQGGCGQKYWVPGVRSPLLVPVRFMLARDQIIKPLNTVTATLVDAGRLSAEARQIMTKKAIRLGAKYILYWDDDVLPPPMGLYTLHNFMERNPEAGAVSGVYTTRENPCEPLVYKSHGTGAWWDFPVGETAEPQPIFGAGAGFLLARVSSIVDVMERLKEEKGEEIPVWADERIMPGDEADSNIQALFGHDLRFCRLLNRYGHQVYVDGRVLCKHLDTETNTVYEMPIMPTPEEEFSADTAPSVDVIVVTFNQPELEARTIRAIREHTEYPNYNLIVHRNKPDVGLAKCWNDLIRESTADYVCLLNPDTVPTKGWLTKLMEHRQGAGAIVPSSNFVHLSQIETTLDRFEDDFEKINAFAATLPEQPPQLLPTASGMCVVFPRSVWVDAGGFDEEFFLYGEDTEFFWRVKNLLGLELRWVTHAYVHHYRAQCTNKAIQNGLDIRAIQQRSEDLVNQKTDLNMRYL